MYSGGWHSSLGIILDALYICSISFLKSMDLVLSTLLLYYYWLYERSLTLIHLYLGNNHGFLIYNLNLFIIVSDFPCLPSWLAFQLIIHQRHNTAYCTLFNIYSLFLWSLSSEVSCSSALYVLLYICRSLLLTYYQIRSTPYHEPTPI